MTKRMLIDATHPEETRVAVVDGTRLEEFDFEIASRRQIKSNIYLAKVTRVEPSLQAAFVEYGGNRHGFLPFPEIHADYYRIPVGDRHALDVYEVEEEAPRQRNEDHGEDDNDGYGPVPAIDVIEATVQPDPVIAESVTEADQPAEDSQAPEAAAEAGAAEPAATNVETVGGDEVEDAQRRRRAQMPRYKIQEVIKRRQIMLVQVSKEERGNKGAAVTTYLSLPGRYCVLMPNTSRGGGVSRKIANPADRKRMKELISDLEIPDGMSVILRTAGVERSKAEIKRDLDYLLRLWENIRELTLESTAPALIYEEGNLVKRAIRDLYTKEISAIEIAGDDAYRQAKDFMRMLMPSHAKRVQPYRDPAIPLFFRYQVESQIDLIHNPVAHLRSGGYIVINQTEALVSIDVNSGRSTRERNIEETALKTNLEAADEIGRQLRLRDMGGLIVIDFIDMDEPRHDAQVERRLKEAMKNDRARIQVGRISPFGLLELSRQRLHPSLIETNFHVCRHCLGTGLVRSIESASLLVLRAIEEEGIKRRAAELSVTVAGDIALYILNQKRAMLTEIEGRYGFSVRLLADDGLIAPEHKIERVKMKPPGTELPPPVSQIAPPVDDEEDEDAELAANAEAAEVASGDGEAADRKRKRRRSRKRRPGSGEDRQGGGAAESRLAEPSGADWDESSEDGAGESTEEARSDEEQAVAGSREEQQAGEAARRRRRGRRGGRNRPRRTDEDRAETPPLAADADETGEADPGFAPGEGELTVVEATAAVVSSPASIPEPITEIGGPYEEPPFGGEPEVPGEPAEDAEPVDVDSADVESRVNGAEDTHEEAQPKPPSPYETVNQPPHQPRRGWWKRIIE